MRKMFLISRMNIIIAERSTDLYLQTSIFLLRFIRHLYH